MEFCVLIPTYNNPKTLRDVVERVLQQCSDVIVVDDGSTVPATSILQGVPVEIIPHNRNLGKGAALRTGFYRAQCEGYTHCVTIDADSQHFPEDIPTLVKLSEENPEAFIIGSRSLTADNMPRGNTFANRFSNFWFRLQTGQNIPDTQSGFRVYPLDSIHGLNHITARYEAELELMVYAAWHGVKMIPADIRVCYPEDRVSHFRPFADFMRITVLNTVLCFGALFYGLPLAIYRKLKKK